MLFLIQLMSSKWRYSKLKKLQNQKLKIDSIKPRHKQIQCFLLYIAQV